jgi:hypothetical protein
MPPTQKSHPIRVEIPEAAGWKTGVIKDVRSRVVVNLAKALGVPVTALLE